MKKLEENIILVGEENLDYNEFVQSLANLSIKNITDILLESRITLPRKLNVTALRLALNEKIVIAKTLNLSDEELFRLRFYPFFNEFQLQKLFTLLNDEELFTNYRKFLMELIIQNNEYLKLEDNLITKILNVPNKFEDFAKYEEILNTVSYDFEGYFDGIKYDDYDDSILKSLTSDDIRVLGEKYGISIPKRLKKDELVLYVKEVMEANGKVIPENVDLNSQSIMMVQRFAKKNNIKISADLKKDECLNYLFHQISKLDVRYKKEVLLNLYLGDSFVFDLSYVLKTEEKAPLPEVVMAEPKVEEPKEEVKLTGVIEVIDEEPKEEAQVTEEPKEEVKEEVKETTEQVVVREVPTFDPKDLVEIITKSVKEIVVDVVKEIAPLFVDKKEEETQVKTEEQLIEEKIYNYDNFSNQTNPNYDEDLHHYIKNFDCKAINPEYEEINIESDKFVINDLAEDNIAPEVVEEKEEDLEDEKALLASMTEEEKVQYKKDKKEKKRQAKIEAKEKAKQAKIDAKNLSKEEKEKRKALGEEEKRQLLEEKKKEKEQIKLEKKAQKVEAKAQAKQAKIDEKIRIKEEKEAEKENKRLEAEQEKIRLKEEKKEKKLQIKEDKKNQKIQLKEDKKNQKIQLKQDKKNQKIQEKQDRIQAKKDAKQAAKDAIIEAKEQARLAKIAEREKAKSDARNHKILTRELAKRNPNLNKVDKAYLEEYKERQEIVRNHRDDLDRANQKRSARNGAIFKFIFWIIFLTALAYVVTGVVSVFVAQAAGCKEYLLKTPFLKDLFTPLINWLEGFIKK